MVSRFLGNGVLRNSRLDFSITTLVALMLLNAIAATGFAQPTAGRNSLAVVQESHAEAYRDFSAELAKLIEFCEEK